MYGEEIKDRQSSVSREGRKTEREVVEILRKDEFISENFYVGTLAEARLSGFLDENNLENLEIDYGHDKHLIDADVCIVKKKDRKVVAVISVKKSFRERGGQTAYWALKVKQSLKDFKYIVATPDVDEELFDKNNPGKKRKWRNILSFECDGVFVYSLPGREYKDGKFFVGKEYLIDFIKSLV